MLDAVLVAVVNIVHNHLQAKSKLDEDGLTKNIWNFIVEGDAMPGILGAVAKTEDSRWSPFMTALQEAWCEDEPDAEYLKEVYVKGSSKTYFSLWQDLSQDCTHSSCHSHNGVPNTMCYLALHC